MLPRVVSFAPVLLLVATSQLSSAAPPITAAGFAPDGKSIVVGSQSGLRILSWPELVPRGSLATELDQVHDLAFSPRGDLLAAVGGFPADAGRVEFWAWPDAKLKRAANVHDDVIYAAAWNSLGDRLATAGGD